MPLGMEVGFDPGGTVLDGDPSPPPQKVVAPLPNFRPISIVAKAPNFRPTSRGRPRPRPHCARWGTSSPSPKEGHNSPPPIFGPCLLLPNGWVDQDATLYEGRSRPRPHCVTWRPSSPLPKGAQSPNFRPMSIVAKRSPISASAEHLSSFPMTIPTTTSNDRQPVTSYTRLVVTTVLSLAF